MSTNGDWVKSEDFEELAAIEAYLQSMMEPVEPRPICIKNLRKRLFGNLDPKEPVLEIDLAPQAPHYMLLAGAGIVSSILIVITSIRAVAKLIGTIEALRRTRSQVAQERSAPMTPVA